MVSFRFGSGEIASHVILELYAAGNLILTDHKLEVGTLQGRPRSQRGWLVRGVHAARAVKDDVDGRRHGQRRR